MCSKAGNKSWKTTLRHRWASVKTFALAWCIMLYTLRPLHLRVLNAHRSCISRYLSLSLPQHSEKGMQPETHSLREYFL